MATKKNNATEVATDSIGFTKESLVKSNRFKDKQDLVNAILDDGVEYTVNQVEDMIQNYLKGKVN